MESTLKRWKELQDDIAGQVICVDDNIWHGFIDSSGYHGQQPLYVAGADISFSTTNECEAVATLTIVRLTTHGSRDLVLSQSRFVQVREPYVSGFLGFREAPIINDLLAQLNENVRRRIGCLLLDGNGILHPRKAGLACHVGVEQSLPTIGVSKSLLCIDGLCESAIREQLDKSGGASEGMDVKGDSGFVWARAIITGNAIHKPIYISVGHKVSLRSAALLVRALCTFRIPDPIRYADVHSRAFLRGENLNIIDLQDLSEDT